MDFLKGSFFWNEAQYSVRSDSFKGGARILTSPTLAAHISEYDIKVPGRAQFITFQLTNELTIGVINIYAHNYTTTPSPYRIFGTRRLGTRIQRLQSKDKPNLELRPYRDNKLLTAFYGGLLFTNHPNHETGSPQTSA
jgi:hypothetical protein